MLLIVTSLCWAQQGRQSDFRQQGNATSSLQETGLVIAHPSLPIGSKIMIKNIDTDSEVEVTVRGRIQASTSRIVDISADTAQAIGLESGGNVLLYVPERSVVIVAEPQPVAVASQPVAAAPPQPVAAEPQPVAGAPQPVSAAPQPVAGAPQPVVTDEPQDRPIHITLHANIITPPQEPAPPQEPLQIIIQQEPPVQQAPRQSETNNPELNWLGWLSYMTALTQQGAQNAQQYFVPPPVYHAPPPQVQYAPPPQVQYAPPQVQQAPPQVQYAPPQVQYAPPPQVQYAPPPQVQQAPPQVQYAPPPQVQQAPPQVQYAPPQVQYAPPPQVQHAPPQVQNVPPPQLQQAPPQVQNVPSQVQHAPPQVNILPSAPTPVANVRVIPAMPDANSRNIYDLQVGAYSSYDAAANVIQQLQNAGFEIVLEQWDGIYRVIIPKVPASSVNNSVNRLGEMGISEIWLRGE